MSLHNKITIYNQPENILVITNYPPKGGGVHTAKTGGVAGFAKNTLLPLAEKLSREGRRIIVLAETIGAPTMYEEDGMFVVRCWSRNHPGLYLQILKQVMQFNTVQNVLIEFEFASYGDFWTTAFFPAFLGALRLMGKTTTLVLHQIITDLWSLNGHLGLRYDSREFQLFSRLLPIFYGAVTHLAHQTVTLEEVLKNRLKGLAPMNRVTVIHHGTEERTTRITRQAARKRLHINTNAYVVMSMGFVTWYKGTDLLLDALKNSSAIGARPLQVIIAGGKSPTLEGKAHYETYYQSIIKRIEATPHARLTGYVPNRELDLYFQAADVVVFPYRTMMSSSGPLSIALSYGKLVLFSHAMRPYLESQDIREALGESGLTPKDILLPQNFTRLSARLTRISHRANQVILQKFTHALAQKRTYANAAEAYVKLLTIPNPAPSWRPLLASTG